MSRTITDKDERYDELFQVENEAEVFGTGMIDDPYPAWHQLREKAPVHKGTLAECMGFPASWSGHFYHTGYDYYSVFTFAGVSEVFTNKDVYSSKYYVDTGGEAAIGHTILSMDGLEHRRYRDLIQPKFQPSVASGWWNDKVIKQSVDMLVSSFEKEGRADLNADFFARLPMHVVTAGFGLSPEEGLEFRHHMQRAVSHASTAEEKAESGKAAAAILEQVIRARRADPKDDLISDLTQAQLKEEDGGTRPLTVEEIMGYCRLIVFAGGGTTWRQLGITTFALLSDPDQLEAVKSDRKLLPNAILESARWHPTDPLFPRTVMKDTTLEGTRLPKGSVVHLCLGSANRDPTRWDKPDAFDVHRPVQRSVAFAAGAHSCLGQHVARQELLGALNAIFDRLPNLRWDPSKPPAKILGGLMARGPGPLHVVFG